MRSNSNKTWEDAASLWLAETRHKRTHRDDKAKLNWIARHWKGKNLSEIDREMIRQLAEAKLAEAKPSTANRYLALIRSIFRRAWREWEWIERVPFIRLFHEPPRRIRWIEADAARALISELPPHSRDAVLFALATGLRHANVVGLRWQQIDMKRRTAWFYSDQVKNGEDLLISLNDTAMEILERRWKLHSEYVFTFKGKPVQRFNTRAFKRAAIRAGIDNFRWHDLRHTWASWLVQEGVPLYTLQEMGGWKTAAMVRRYAHLSPAHNLRHAQKLDKMLQY